MTSHTSPDDPRKKNKKNITGTPKMGTNEPQCAASSTSGGQNVGFCHWQSIRQIREVYGYDSIKVMFAKANKLFCHSLSNHQNDVLKFLSTLVVEVVS